MPENREQLGRIIAGFYQTYVSTFSRSIYFNPGVNDTIIDGSLSALSSRLFVARLNAAALSALLFLIAALIAITLIKQPRPKPGGMAVALAGDGSHGRFMSVVLGSPLPTHHRYSVSEDQRRLVHTPNEGLASNPRPYCQSVLHAPCRISHSQ
jgi:hypothetical protein